MTELWGSPHTVVWLALFVMCVAGTSLFDRFECETAAWRKMLRWALAAVLSQASATMWGYWALVVLTVLGGVGLVAHLRWCRSHGIHPIRATPRRRYYELRGWTWVE